MPPRDNLSRKQQASVSLLSHPGEDRVLAEVVEAATGQGVETHQVLEVADPSPLPRLEEPVSVCSFRGPGRALVGGKRGEGLIYLAAGKAIAVARLDK